MRVMTWNLWWRFGRQWQERQHGILATLRGVQPDLAGLQEVWGTALESQAHWLGDKLGMHAAFAAPSLPPPPEHSEYEVGVGLLSRWPIQRVEEHRMPSRHRSEIVALTALIEHPTGPLHAVVSCIDWEQEYADQRMAQARYLADLLTDPSRDGPLPVLLLGDLNSPPTTPEMKLLASVAVDAWTASGAAGDAGHTLSTRNPYAPRGIWLSDQRIDYVLARPGRVDQPVVVEQAFLAGEPHDGRCPSDHYAVVADLHL
jgi:endonuclease/exonuclease/phosphatase family metal-dependent hydrolase